MKDQQKPNEELREEAVQTLYECLLPKHDITKEECYEIYDQMQKTKREKNIDER
jgi:hypothetical protein